jgi:hypothetical protein
MTTNEIEKSARAELAGVNPRIHVYQWFGLSLSGQATETKVSVECEMKSYVRNQPNPKQFANRDEYLAAAKTFRLNAQQEAVKIVDNAAIQLANAGFKVKHYNEYGWPKLIVLK